MTHDPDETQEYHDSLTAARAGDASSFWRMCDRMRPRLRNLVVEHMDAGIAERVDASDIVQDALVSAVRAFPQFQGQTIEQWEAWLVQIVKNEVHDTRRYWHQPRRSIKRRGASLEEHGRRELVPGDGSSPSAHAMRLERAQQILALVGRLPPDEERVVRLRHIEGKDLAEIAELIGRTPDGAAGLLKRAMARLRQMMPEGI